MSDALLLGRHGVPVVLRTDDIDEMAGHHEVHGPTVTFLGEGAVVGIAKARSVVVLGLAVMTAAGLEAHGFALVALTACGLAVMAGGLVGYLRVLPARLLLHPLRASAWRFPIASTAVALAVVLTVAPVLAYLVGGHPNLWLPCACGFVLGQAWLLGRLDRALGRYGRLPRRRFVQSLLTSSLGMTATAGVASLADDLDRSPWPAVADAVVVAIVSAAGSRFVRPSHHLAGEGDLEVLSRGEAVGAE